MKSMSCGAGVAGAWVHCSLKCEIRDRWDVGRWEDGFTLVEPTPKLGCFGCRGAWRRGGVALVSERKEHRPRLKRKRIPISNSAILHEGPFCGAFGSRTRGFKRKGVARW